MIKKIDAIFDGDVLRPAEPLNLKPNTRVSITVDVPEANLEDHGSFLETALSLGLEGPADWSDKIDSYLYGGTTESDA